MKIEPLVLLPGKTVAVDTLTRGLPLSIVIYAMIVPVAFLDLCTSLYQALYFSGMDIPKVERGKYLTLERWKLPKLTPLQRMHCLYCDYVNGTLAWAKEVANTTEAYSCAIRTPSVEGREHQKGFMPIEDFR